MMSCCACDKLLRTFSDCSAKEIDFFCLKAFCLEIGGAPDYLQNGPRGETTIVPDCTIGFLKTSKCLLAYEY